MKNYNENEIEYKPSARSLAEKLGFNKDDRILIVNADDAGMCHAGNGAVESLFADGLVSSSSIMASCAWYPEIAAFGVETPETDFGVHLTHTCEWDSYRWSPLSGRDSAPGLRDKDGYMWRRIEDVYASSSTVEAETESRAQIERCFAAGIDITHLDSHMGTLHFDVRYHEVYQRLAVEYDLPVRMASRAMLDSHGAGFVRDSLADAGIICPDYLIYGGHAENESTEEYWLRMLGGLETGVTELFIHPALPGDEIEGIMEKWHVRSEEYRLFKRGGVIESLLENNGVKIIGYRSLRRLQRMMRSK